MVTLKGARASTGNADSRKIVLWGTYDLGKPRVRIMRQALLDSGIEMVEIHQDVWAGVEDKSQASGFRIKSAMILRHLLAYFKLLTGYWKAADHGTVVIGYMGQFDMLVLAGMAKLRGKRVIWDAFLSLYDTVVFDRRRVTRGRPSAIALFLLEKTACRLADRIILDTSSHARRFSALFGIPQGRFASVFVGAESTVFPVLAPRTRSPGEPLRILFYGQFTPLHGIDTILEAASRHQGRTYRWHLIGSGQEDTRIRDLLAATAFEHVVWTQWVPYEQLSGEIANSDICLGIFGTSDKAASVVPNKVFQALASERPIVTRDSEAMRELVTEPVPEIELVTPGDPSALLAGIDRVARYAGQPASREYRTIRAITSPDRLAADWVRAVTISDFESTPPSGPS